MFVRIDNLFFQITPPYGFGNILVLFEGEWAVISLYLSFVFRVDSTENDLHVGQIFWGKWLIFGIIKFLHGFINIVTKLVHVLELVIVDSHFFEHFLDCSLVLIHYSEFFEELFCLFLLHLNPHLLFVLIFLYY